MSLTLKLNGVDHTVDAEPGTPLLWVIRDELKMTGTKFGCGVASLRRLHGAHRWRAGAVLPDLHRRYRRGRGHDD